MLHYARTISQARSDFAIIAGILTNGPFVHGLGGLAMVEKPPSDSNDAERKPYQDVYQEIERQFLTLINQENQETAKNIFNDLLRMGRDGYQFGVDLISELCTELTGVKSLQIVPKGPLELDVDIKRKKDLVLKFKHTIAPLVDLTAITFGEDLNFGAVVDKEKKGLRMNIRRGLKLSLKLGPLDSTIDVKGSALLSRGEKNQLMLSTTVNIPGIDNPVTLSIPLTQVFAQRKKVI